MAQTDLTDLETALVRKEDQSLSATSTMGSHPILARGWSDTWRAWKGQLIMSAILALAGVPLGVLLGLLSKLLSWPSVLFIIILYGSFLALTAIWKFFRAPVALYVEQRAENRALCERLESWPDLQAVRWGADVRPTVPGATFLHLTLKNNPKTSAGDESEARNVRAYITFFDEDGEECFEVDGRWSDTVEPSDGFISKQPISDFQMVNFSIGQRQELAIAFKHLGDRTCFPFNHENYPYRDQGFRNPRRILTGKTFTAIVEVRGQRVHKRWKLTFENIPGTLNPRTCDVI